MRFMMLGLGEPERDSAENILQLEHLWGRLLCGTIHVMYLKGVSYVENCVAYEACPLNIPLVGWHYCQVQSGRMAAMM